jgi:hypothetical protein
MAVIFELIAACGTLKQKWWMARVAEEKRFAKERIDVKPPEPPQPEGTKPGDFLDWRKYPEYWKAADLGMTWQSRNIDLAESLPYLVEMAEDYKNLSLITHDVYAKLPNKQIFSVLGGFDCPLCACQPIPLPATQIDCSDSSHTLCSNNPSHLVRWIPWGG